MMYPTRKKSVGRNVFAMRRSFLSCCSAHAFPTYVQEVLSIHDRYSSVVLEKDLLRDQWDRFGSLDRISDHVRVGGTCAGTNSDQTITAPKRIQKRPQR